MDAVLGGVVAGEERGSECGTMDCVQGLGLENAGERVARWIASENAGERVRDGLRAGETLPERSAGIGASRSALLIASDCVDIASEKHVSRVSLW